MIIERLVRLYAKLDFAYQKSKSEAGRELHKFENIKRRQQERDAAREVTN